MSRIRLVGVAVVACGTLCAALAIAKDITTKKMLIKDNANTAKRSVQVLSKDPTVLFSDAIAPDSAGAALHIYSATDDYCAILPGGSEWTVNKKHTLWKYKNKLTKNSAQIKNGHLQITIKSNVGFSLLDNGTQGTVNAQAKFGLGTKFCMRCTGNKKDSGKVFQGQDCVAAPCDAEPSICDPTATTTTTSSTTSTTTPPPGIVLKGALNPTVGRFNFHGLGPTGADAECGLTWAGTHACTVTDLASAQTAGDLAGLKDLSNTPVTSFWGIDSGADPFEQCNDDATTPGTPVAGLNWQYATAHTMSRGQRLPLNNMTGTLGALVTGVQCNIAGTSWVGCCL